MSCQVHLIHIKPIVFGCPLSLYLFFIAVTSGAWQGICRLPWNRTPAHSQSASLMVGLREVDDYGNQFHCIGRVAHLFSEQHILTSCSILLSVPSFWIFFVLLFFFFPDALFRQNWQLFDLCNLILQHKVYGHLLRSCNYQFHRQQSASLQFIGCFYCTSQQCVLKL